MESIVAFFSSTTGQVILAAWLVVVGVCVVLYSLYLKALRQNRFAKYGLNYSKKQRAQNFLEQVNKLIGSFVSMSETDVQQKLIAAGFYDAKFSKWLFPLKYGALIIGGGLIVFFCIQTAQPLTKTMLYTSLWVVFSLLGPDWYLSMRRKALQRKLSERLPYLLDLMGVCVQTGMTIESSMGYLAKEMVGFDRDIAYMLNKTNERAKLVGLEQSLEELYDRVPTPEIRSFVMTLSQSLQYGSSIYSVLTTLAMDIREIQMLGIEEKIGKLSAKMSVPLILFIMLPIVILITAPGIMRMMAGS